MAQRRTDRFDARCADLVGIAREALVSRGLEQFSMREIAAEAEMKLGNLQYYYPTRADLLEAVARSDLERDLAAVEASGSLAESARSLLRNWSDGGSTVWLAVALLAFHDARFRALSVEVYARFYAAMVERIRPLAGAAGEAELAARARLITSVLDGAALQLHSALSGNPRLRRELTDRAIAAIDAIARG